MKRVVITGLGMVSPLAVGVSEGWRRLLNCESGIKKVKSFDVSDLVCKIAGQVPSEKVEQKADTLFDPLNYISARELNRMDTFIVYAIAAASEAITDSGVNSFNDEEKERTGVLIGSGIGGLPAIYETSVNMHVNGARRVSPFFIPSSLINLASGHVSIKFGLKGPNHAVVTACATGTHAIGDAARIIQVGSADVMVAGGAEAAVCRAGIAGFSAARALSTARNDTPEEASRPWDKSRDGFIMAEGSGIVVLEELEHAKKRGAKIYAEVIGYGMSSDAYHVTAPLADGDGAYRAMREALRSAEVSSDKIDYINAHGTSTQAGDVGELRAVERLLGEGTKASMSSTKSAIGHLLGAAGAVEAIFSTLALRDQVAPATLNLHDAEETFLDLVPLQPRQRKIEYAMSNSFGFGGTNASLILKRYS
ncbi:MAG: beta-ketoacyl-ACP synthase II [Alphaproteobacteria bacterium]|nr:beta-ketoacyl-ACP synthase II [Alphaproteobacteria bacterium]